jgi:hypothetical protein
MTRAREPVHEAIALLRAHGFTPTISNGKHVKVSWIDGVGRRRVLTFSHSHSGNWRGPRPCAYAAAPHPAQQWLAWKGRMMRERLPDRRPCDTFDFEVGGLRYTCTVGRFADGRIGELFLSNHKSNSTADTNARDAAISFSFAVQHGADPNAIREALCRDSQGNASGPLGAALDALSQ